ncbi:MAG: transporter [Leptolyngbyaceae cyanobacterium SM2_5_2]|nr:transporter [Leptolyngbyaceae cyanobacterium SM2_5_2]
MKASLELVIHTALPAGMAFLATNLDDFFLLIVMFAQVPNQFSYRQIFWGRYLGFAALVALSLPGFFGGLMLPKAWIGLLGLVPILLGLSQLRPQTDAKAKVQFVNSLKLPLLSTQIATVAGLTLANGGDNIGIYVSLFAGQTWAELGLTLLVFALLIPLWYGLALRMVSQPLVQDYLVRVGHRLTPWVLIGLGLFILLDSEAYRLVAR